ncbi:MAG: hypothetical protein ACI9SP_003499 [Arenicella sp.]|jgi:hypothetical protein
MLQGKSGGNLYYVRLKTNLGLFYKIGFTTMKSVEQRLGYSGSGDALLIDEVLLFFPLEDAERVEGELHSLLSDKSAFAPFSRHETFPLAGNGQTELYAEDVLKLDANYTEEQGEATMQNVFHQCAVEGGYDKELDFATQPVKPEEQPEELGLLWLIVVFVICAPIRLLTFIYYLFFDIEEEKRKAEAKRLAFAADYAKGEPERARVAAQRAAKREQAMAQEEAERARVAAQKEASVLFLMSPILAKIKTRNRQ